MATTYDASFGYDVKTHSGNSFFKRVFDRFIEARQKEANRQIMIYLQGMDAETLSRYGYSPAQINDILNGKPAA